MSITGELNELESLNKEIVRISTNLRGLRKQKKDIEDRISKFIKKEEKPGLKYRGTQFVSKTTQVVDRSRSTKVKESDAINVLKNYGMSDGDSKVVVGEIIEAMRGPRKEETKLIVKKTKK